MIATAVAQAKFSPIKLTPFKYFFSGDSLHPCAVVVNGTETLAREIYCTVPVRSVFDAAAFENEKPCFFFEGEARDIVIRNGIVLVS
jgi:hypothetical protein